MLHLALEGLKGKLCGQGVIAMHGFKEGFLERVPEETGPFWEVGQLLGYRGP